MICADLIGSQCAQYVYFNNYVIWLIITCSLSSRFDDHIDDVDDSVR